MALRHEGKCIGGPYDGEDWVYFSDVMPVQMLDGIPIGGDICIMREGYYKNDDRGLWIWFGPSVKQRKIPVTG